MTGLYLTVETEGVGEAADGVAVDGVAVVTPALEGVEDDVHAPASMANIPNATISFLAMWLLLLLAWSGILDRDNAGPALRRR
jgi:hypothetical protein